MLGRVVHDRGDALSFQRLDVHSHERALPRRLLVVQLVLRRGVPLKVVVEHDVLQLLARASLHADAVLIRTTRRDVDCLRLVSGHLSSLIVLHEVKTGAPLAVYIARHVLLQARESIGPRMDIDSSVRVHHGRIVVVH